jgi:hypothetical protein
MVFKFQKQSGVSGASYIIKYVLEKGKSKNAYITEKKNV